MHNILVAGAGKIGSLVALLLTESGDYKVHLVDKVFIGSDVRRVLQSRPDIQTATLDFKDCKATQAYITQHQIKAVISSLPYFLNIYLAEAAKAADTHYFDLTEDTSTATAIKLLSSNSNKAFVPQCGLAPGFISIVANSLMKEFDVCHQAKLRVGALPERTSNGLNYSLTWSTDGVINEYGNPCFGIEEGKIVTLAPLGGLETIILDGCEYEAFHTSGGMGSLGDLYVGNIQLMNYKTIRYPGHCEKMRFLMNDLKLNSDRDTLKRILERAVPKTYQDMVIIYVTVEGIKEGELVEKSYLKKIYPKMVGNMLWSAIQVSTASGLCFVVDKVLHAENQYKGHVFQERFCLADMLANRFGQNFA
jgi:saccharopine dehydrogenase-like NADP-dependent oxidoreductase